MPVKLMDGMAIVAQNMNDLNENQTPLVLLRLSSTSDISPLVNGRVILHGLDAMTSILSAQDVQDG